MRVYVVIVTYNASHWLFKCLNSLKQSSLSVDIVIVDNNSTDGTYESLKNNFKEITVFKNETNLGFGRANNLGIKYALEHQADFVFLMNQDVWLRPDTLQRLIQVSGSHPDYYVLSPMHLAGNESQLDLNFSHYAGPVYCSQLFSDFVIRPNNLKDVYETYFVNAAMWLLPKECLLKIGGFDPIFSHYGEDNDFINRIRYHGFKVGICPHLYGVHDRSQEAFDLNKMNEKERLNRMRTGYLISLKNINRSLLPEFIGISNALIREITVNLIELNFHKAAINSKVLTYIIRNIRKISVNRKISKQIGAPLIWVKN